MTNEIVILEIGRFCYFSENFPQATDEEFLYELSRQAARLVNQFCENGESNDDPSANETEVLSYQVEGIQVVEMKIRFRDNDGDKRTESIVVTVAERL